MNNNKATKNRDRPENIHIWKVEKYQSNGKIRKFTYFGQSLIMVQWNMGVANSKYSFWVKIMSYFFGIRRETAIFDDVILEIRDRYFHPFYELTTDFLIIQTYINIIFHIKQRIVQYYVSNRSRIEFNHEKSLLN